MRLPRSLAVPENGVLATREYPDTPHPYRGPYQRDRGRIVHSRAFRRLAGKTQVFTERYSDHFRSRLTHTMEVAQIARTLASALGLNEDFTEALALVHDIGHPPFGHAGEHALDESLQQYGLRFDHNLHALRIVQHFELRYVAFRGLNLTLGIREGIVKHSRDYSPHDHPELAAYFLDRRPPLEAQLIDLADEIAYLTADLDDGVEAEILTLPEIRGNVVLLDRFYPQIEAAYPHAPAKLVFQEALKRMLDALVSDLVQETARRVAALGVKTLDDLRNHSHRIASLSTPMEKLRLEAKQYLYRELYRAPELEPGHRQAAQVVHDLFHAWVRDPRLLPASYQAQIETEGAPRVVADYIAGMTDGYILALHRQLAQ